MNKYYTGRKTLRLYNQIFLFSNYFNNAGSENGQPAISGTTLSRDCVSRFPE